MGKNYIFAFDLALNRSGITIFDNDANVILITSVETKAEKTHPLKLKIIAKFLLDLKEKYPPEKIIIERGFYRYAASTEAIYKVCGVVQYLFWEIPQIFYPPMTVKKVVGGKGNMKKDELREVIEKEYKLSFKNDDESDSFAVGICYFKSKGII